MENNFQMVAKTLFGFEDLLANELTQLGAQKVKKGVRNVTFYGDKGFMYKCNLGLRTAIKILKPIASFKVVNEADLYDKIYKIKWEDYVDYKGTIAINSTVHSTVFNHSQYISLKAKDAIVDRFRALKGERPSIDLKFPDLKINIHIDKLFCNVSLDSSNIAPINEVLAAGLIMLSGWDGQSDLLDPMCGSGTILIEAAMIACNIPPNLLRNEFAFEKWTDWDVDLFEKIENSLLEKTRDFHHNIYGIDKAPSAVTKAIENVKNANLESFISIRHDDYFKTSKSNTDFLHIIFNPPYGERLEINMEELYGNIGNTLKRNYSNSNAWFITSNVEALKYVGLRPSRKIKLFNAKLESTFVKYEVYDGSKKAKKNL